MDDKFLNTKRFLKKKKKVAPKDVVLQLETLTWVKDLSPTYTTLGRYKDGTWNISGHMTKKITEYNVLVIQIASLILMVITLMRLLFVANLLSKNSRTALP